MSGKRAFYIIESGKAMEMVKHHIAERIRVKNSVIDLLEKLGAEGHEAWTDIRTGVLVAVSFNRGKQPTGFTVPDSRGKSWPKKGTEWATRFSQQQGYSPANEEIAHAFNVPLSIEYTANGGESGSRGVGFPLTQCGYLYLGKEGPYAMWIPDVGTIVSEMEREGHTVTSNARLFSMFIDGCRRIEPEEWEIMVLQHELREKNSTRDLTLVASPGGDGYER